MKENEKKQEMDFRSRTSLFIGCFCILGLVFRILNLTILCAAAWGLALLSGILFLVLHAVKRHRESGDDRNHSGSGHRK